MRYSHLFLLPLFGLTACGGDKVPTGPTVPASSDAAALSTTVAALRVVNSLADPGDGICNSAQCTLREAIKHPLSTAVSFAAGLTGTITLARPAAGGGPLLIEKPLTITGPSAGITIRRRSTDPAFRILRITSGATVTLTNLTLRNGKTDLPGGGIINYGALSLINCTLADNVTTQHGGGIENHGPLTVTRSTFVNNSAARGGGIDNHNVPLTVTNSTIAGSAGDPALWTTGATLAMTNSTVRDNLHTGIASQYARSTLDHVRVVNNAGDGISKWDGTLTLAHSTVARNGGAGVSFSGRNVEITSSTITNNSNGGISIHNHVRVGSRLWLTNSTVSENTAADGAGILSVPATYGSSAVYLVNSTIAYNSASTSGGGIKEGTEDTFTLTNSIVAKNNAPTGPDIYTGQPCGGEWCGGYTTASFSLIGDGAGNGLENTDGNKVGNMSPYGSAIDPRLGGLELNGGPTRTYALLAGSPAIDAASPTDCPVTDQRGVVRPQGPACDMGSYEK